MHGSCCALSFPPLFVVKLLTYSNTCQTSTRRIANSFFSPKFRDPQPYNQCTQQVPSLVRDDGDAGAEQRLLGPKS